MDYADKFPIAAIAIGDNFYVDDLIVSVSTIKEGIHLQKDLNILVKESGLELGKWDSNEPKVLAHVPENSRAKNSSFKIYDDQFVSKALGVS
jgi:hypothetical protein